MSSLAVPAKAPLARSSSDSARYLFVDTVRFWSMFAVLAMHCTEAFRLKMPWIVQTLRTPCKFGTIGFFLISGFLLGGRLEKTSPVQYMKRRLKRVFLPWLFWLSAYSLVDVCLHCMDHKLSLSFDVLTLRHLAGTCRTAVVYTSFWFVPNLLIAMSILLIFRRWLDDLRFGAVLLAATLFYSLNIYRGWLPVAHSEALFGFVFFLWLGNYAALHLDQMTAWVERIAMWQLVAASVGSFALSMVETRILFHMGQTDPANTLRISNLIYSVVVVLALFKVRRVSWPKIIDVPRQTFGIYLMHPIVLALVMRTIFGVMEMLKLTGETEGIMLAEWAVAVVVSYGVSLLATRYLGTVSWMQWTIGLSSSQTPRAPRAVSRHEGAGFEFEGIRAAAK